MPSQQPQFVTPIPTNTVSQPQIYLPFVQIAATMASASLSGIPPELLCQIFQSADDFSVVAALAQTARIFYNTWRMNSTSICKAVAPRVFLTPTDAECLVDMQEEAEDGCDDRAILWAKRLLSNARYASAAYKKWEVLSRDGDLVNFDKDDDLPSERACFEHAFYCVRTVGVMARATHLREQASEFLDRCDLRELCRLVKLSTWVIHLSWNDYRSLGLDFGDATWRAGCDLVANSWIAYSNNKDFELRYPICWFTIGHSDCKVCAYQRLSPDSPLRQSPLTSFHDDRLGAIVFGGYLL